MAAQINTIVINYTIRRMMAQGLNPSETSFENVTLSINYVDSGIAESFILTVSKFFCIKASFSVSNMFVSCEAGDCSFDSVWKSWFELH